MSRFFEVVEVEEDSPKFLIVGESVISESLVKNLLSGGAQVFCLNSSTNINHQNLYKLTSSQIDKISKNIKYIFFEKDPETELEKTLLNNFSDAKFIYLNPRSLKTNSIMIYAPLIYGPEIKSDVFGFLGFNLKNILKEQKIILPENLTEDIYPVYIDDVVENIEKAMFANQNNESQNLILLVGEEKIPLASFFSNLISRLKKEIETEYLDKKLVFKTPNAGRIEKGTTPIEKGLGHTAEFLNLYLENIKEDVKDIKKNIEENIPKFVRETPRNIPIVNIAKEEETEFAINNNFLKKVYSGNMEYLKKNSLLKEKTIQKEKAQDFESKMKKKKQHLSDILINAKSIKFQKPEIKIKFLGKPRKKLIYTIFAIFGLIILPFFIFLTAYLSSLFFFKQSAVALSEKNIGKSQTYGGWSKKTFVVAGFFHTKINKYYYQLINKDASYKNINSLMDMQKSGLQILNSISLSYLNLAKAMPYIVSGRQGSGNIDKYMQSSFVEIENAKNILSSVVGQLKNQIPHPPKFLWFANQEYYRLITKIPALYKDLNKAELVLKSLPDIIGKNDKKTYALIFQNNMELRATGGFIGSFAMITFEKEKLTDFSVFDVYDADGQLKGSVPPPPEILHFLGQPNWFLRDANVNPDFATSAKQISWFLQKEMKSQVDGVIAIDISFVENVLKSTGPIYLSDFKETISSSNLFEKAERASELNFFPGSTKKKDFLSVLSQQLWQKLLVLKADKLIQIIASSQNLGEQKHLQMYFENSRLEELAGIFQVDGSLKTTKGEEYLALVESNYGANKANYFVKREINHTININSDGFVEHKVNISYSNFSPLSLWPTGDYKPYVKFYIPKDTIFKDFSFENKQIKLSEFLNEYVLEQLKPKTEQLVLQGDENNKRYFGTFITVPVGKTKNVIFTWQSANPRPENLKNFEFYFQKQAGTIRDEYNLTVIFPEKLKPSSNIVPSVASKGELQYNLNTERDIDLQITFK